ncbi:MAG: VWA domain-containing protein [Acidobacteriia bacterium]|nr:VWA domain-containing protein [Terriglobia bacterium]
MRCITNCRTAPHSTAHADFHIPLASARSLATALTLLLLSAFMPAAAQEPEVHITPRVDSSAKPSDVAGDPALKTHTKPLRSDVEMVLVPVTVTDHMDRLVTGLAKENFQVFQDKQQQEVRHLSSEDAPISAGILFDMSGSMKDKFDKAKEAVVQFMQIANPDDEFFLIGFSDKPRLLSDFVESPSEIQSKLVFTAPKGMTALLDATYMGLNQMRHARHRRKALLIISDGGDNHSRYSESEIKSAVQEADVQIYAIGIFDQTPRTWEERFGPVLLSDVTDVTGGRSFVLSNLNDLPDVAAKIGAELRNQYVIAYVPQHKPKDGKWHKIRVKLLPPKGLPSLSIHAKRGYYAAQE